MNANQRFRFTDPSERCFPVGTIVREIGCEFVYSAQYGEHVSFITLESESDGETVTLSVYELCALTAMHQPEFALAWTHPAPLGMVDHASIDGACGMGSVRDIARAIGVTLKFVSSSRNRTLYILTDSHPALFPAPK